MTIIEKTLQLYSINKTKIEEILINNDNININILSGNPPILLEQLNDVDSSEISIYPMDALEMSYSFKIGNGNVFLSDKYHYDKDTNTLSLYKLI
jgi:hypothetical protein